MTESHANLSYREIKRTNTQLMFYPHITEIFPAISVANWNEI